MLGEEMAGMKKRRLRCGVLSLVGLFLLVMPAGAAQAADLPPGDLYNHILEVEANGSEGSNQYKRTSPGASSPGVVDTQIAAPFTVPAGVTWNVTGARTDGFIDEAEPLFSLSSNVNVWIYRDVQGAIGPAVYEALNVPAANQPDYEVPIPSVELASGNYWFSIQQVDAWRILPGNEHAEWYWNVEGLTESRLASPSGGSPLFALSGTLGTPRKVGDPPSSCGTVAPVANNFKPRRPKLPTQLGLRAVLRASQPSDFTVTAKLATRGELTPLGKFTKKVITFKKLRIPVPAARLGLKRLDVVTLHLHVVIRPIGSSACEVVKRDFKLRRTVWNIERALADRSIVPVGPRGK